MMKKLITFALLFCFSCAEENLSKHCDFLMFFSSAQPIQFWLSGCETFNEADVCGARDACFCTPFNCDDPIRIQFTDENEDGVFTLSIEDEDGNEIYNDTIPKTDLFDDETYVKSVYDYSFVPSALSPDLCNQKIRIKIYEIEPIPGTEDMFAEYLFDSDLDGWDNSTVGGTTSDWAWSSDLGGTAKNTTVETFPTKTLQLTSASVPQQQFFIRIRYQILNANSNLLFLRFLIRDSGNNQLYNQIFTTLGPHDSIETAILHITNEDVWLNADVFQIASTSTDYDAGDIIYIASIEIYTEQTQAIEAAKSDCIDIKERHSCTKKITYSNARNYAGLIYQNESPEIEFTFRVPSVFFRQRFPKEQESLKLSSDVINLNSEVRTQQLFDTDYLPGFIHKKLNLIFAHHSIEIDNQFWVCEEEYELIETDRRNQKQKARVWLTEADEVIRNVV